MSTLTPNFNLIQPEETDPFEDFRAWYNATLAIIDANLGGGGSKHTIIDENGQTLPNRTYLEFTGGVQVTDDAVNNKTVVNVTGGGGGSSTLAGLSDVTLTSPTDGQVLEYDSITQKWINANPSGSMHVYSTTEKIVGKWIDSKPVYEKTIEFPITSTLGSGFNTIESMPNIVPISIKGFLVNQNDGRVYPLNYSNAGATSSLFYYQGNITLNIQNDSWGTTYKLYVIVEYTKTTD